MNLIPLLNTWLDLPFYAKFLGIIGIYGVIGFLTYQIGQINGQIAQQIPSRKQSLKGHLMNACILLLSALAGSLGLALGPLLTSFPYAYQYVIGLVLTGLWSLCTVYQMGSFHSGTWGTQVLETTYVKRMVELPVTFFKALYQLVNRIVHAILAPGRDPWGLFIGVSLLVLLPYGFVSQEVFLKIVCLTLGGMGLTLSFSESLTKLFNYSFFPEPVRHKHRILQLILGAAGFFSGILVSEISFILTFQTYYLMVSGIAGFLIGIGVGIPLTETRFYYQQLEQEQDRQRQIEKSDVEKLLTRISRHMEDYRRLIVSHLEVTPLSFLTELEENFQAIKAEFLSHPASYRNLKERSIQLENRLKVLIREVYQTKSTGEEKLGHSVGDSFTKQAEPKVQAKNGGEQQVWQSGGGFTSQTRMGQKSFQGETEISRKALQQILSTTRMLIDELKVKNAEGGAVLSNTLALEARLNGLHRKLEGRRIALATAYMEASKLKEMIEMLSYAVASEESAEVIKPLTEAECREILNVNAKASKEEIKKAYKELAKLYHPDKFVNSPPEMKEKADKAFKRINEAYQFLMNQPENS
jgi:hypothetical protein